MCKGLWAMLLLGLAGCAGGGPDGLTEAERDRIAGRAVVTAENEQARVGRASAQSSVPAPWTAPMIGAAVALLGELNESGRTRVGAVPQPERDPTLAARGAVIDYMVASLGGVRGGRPLDATGIEASSAGARAEALFGRAQQQGFPGVIVDLQPLSFRVRSAGVGTGLRTERFYLDYEARLLVVDAADGAILAAGRCDVDSRAAAFTLAEIEAGGAGVLERASDLVAQQCAAQLIQDRLLPRPGN